MKHTKIKLAVILALGICMAQLNAQTLNLRQTSGTLTPYLLGNIKKISFSSGNIQIENKSNSSDNYLLSTITYINFQSAPTIIASIDKPIGTIIYPNPVQDVLNIRLLDDIKSLEYVEILSMEGIVILKASINAESSLTQLNISELNSGIYFCHIKSTTLNETIKFIKK